IMMRTAFPKAVGSGRRGARPEYRPVPGSEKTPLPGAYIVGLPNPSRSIEVTLLLRPRAEAEGLPSLEKLGARSPHERRHLTREAFAAAHGADPADVQEVLRFAHQHGLRFVGRNLAARTVHLSGTIANFKNAFRVG